MPRKGEKPPNIDIFELLEDTGKKEKKRKRDEILASMGTREFFAEGTIVINRRICHGVECKLCIKACPTNALFWRAGEVGLTEELCVYCGACVLSCIVDDCIRITRKRLTGEMETFSKPKDFLTKQNNLNTRKRLERIKEAFPKPEDYLNRKKKKT